MANDNKRSAFNATRLTSSTFLIKEFDDIYSEHPYVYAIIIPAKSESVLSSRHGTIILIDTGCGGASNDPNARISSLREFIETVEVTDNDNKPLNGDDDRQGRMGYIVVLTHCHYDHILGVEHFSDSLILASSHYPEFFHNIPEHSLCNFLNIHTPKYKPTLVPHGHTISNRITILHTPGHTPDSLTVYDPTSEQPMLYVGDSLYEYEPIIFPSEGSIVDWFRSVEALIEFVRNQESLLAIDLEDKEDSDVLGTGAVTHRVYNQRGAPRQQGRILLNAGHVTCLEPALTVLQTAKVFIEDVVGGREPVRRRWVKRGEQTVEYRQSRQDRDTGIRNTTGETNSRFSLICPERLHSRRT
ncbi:Metallo-hydrolase/oxidoreductase [Lentinula detonsa]|uniref:Metallo-hydrolase/oxidoreductase n=1 Tax=Lentinula detonsa TaxID=2804962 RepID=A0A9W8P066_9AGAR|nr:Metallo-hydrolase/oxidoreductase [Lentinula detonsa]